MSRVTFGPYSFDLSHPDKVLFPGVGITKGDLAGYYRELAPVMLPYLEDRPLSLQRFPDGIDGDGFYQKEAGGHFPDFVDRVTVKKEGGSVHQVVCNKAATLVYLAGQAVITPHPWLSRTGRLHRPDLLVFDLDPPGEGFEPVKRAARDVREMLEEIGLISFVKTTGSKGLHVVAPLDRSADFDAVRALARDAARLLAARHPDRLTVEVRKDKRKGRLFLDTARNAYAQTAVAPYAVRALPGAPVAAPLDWEELGDGKLDARSYTLQNVRRRLGQREDPWKGMMRRARSIEGPRGKLDRLLGSEDEDGDGD